MSRMIFIETTFQDPNEQLHYDEFLLDQIEVGSTSGFLRVWESPSYFVVLGRSNSADVEADVAACEAEHIPILKRCSGGGTVVQGPGCLNYAVVLPYSFDLALEKIDTTSQYILGRISAELSRELPGVSVQGISDITLGNRKFSGNAQRRKRRGLLFHGTLLYDFDLTRVSRYLKFPSKQPEYRDSRSHEAFVCNISLTKSQLIAALRSAWR